MEEEKFCSNCIHLQKSLTEEPCRHCYEKSKWDGGFKFRTGDLVISKINHEESKIIYIYLRNKWVLRVPYYVTVGTSNIILSTGYRLSEMIDKLIKTPDAECEWLDELAYASPYDITEHNAEARMISYWRTFSTWFSELISGELSSDQVLKMAMKAYCGKKEPKVFTTPNMIKNVIFRDPATIIFWEDGTKTVVKTQDGEKYDKEKGFAMAVCKKVFGNERDYYNVFKRWMKKGKEVK